MIRMLLEGMLTDLGHTVAAEAGAIDEALTLAKQGEFDFAVLDVNLNISDAEIVASASTKTSVILSNVEPSEPNNILTLKRQRDFDVDGASSEWRVDENVLVINA